MDINLFSLAFSIYKTYGRETAKRFLTPPRSFVEKVCKRTGANVDEALAARDFAVEAELTFLEELLD